MRPKIVVTLGVEWPGSRLTPIREEPSYVCPSKQVKRVFQCRCRCGTLVSVRLEKLKSVHTTSCGCVVSEQGIERSAVARAAYFNNNCSKHWLYERWKGIKERLYNKSDENYRYYGAKGILMWSEWKNDFWSFACWIENVERMCIHYPFEVHRINSRLHYHPLNCVCLSPEDHRICHKRGLH